MKRKFGKPFVLIPMGLFLISGALAALVTMKTSDVLTGAIMGIGIGLAALPFIMMVVKPNMD